MYIPALSIKISYKIPYCTGLEMAQWHPSNKLASKKLYLVGEQ